MKNFSKHIDENLTYAINWTQFLANENDGAGDTIDTSYWEIEPAGLTIEAQSVDLGFKRSVIKVSGGESGTTYKLSNTVSLSTSQEVVIDYITLRVIS